MRKEIYLKNFNSDEVLNNFTKNPYKSTVFFKNFLETQYVNYTKEIKDAVNNNAEIIHIKNIDQKNYNIMTPYDGEVQISGIEELICHMYGVIGIIGSLPVLYKEEDKNIIRAVAPRRNSQSPYND